MLGAEIKGALSFSGSEVGSDRGRAAIVANNLVTRDFVMQNARIAGALQLSDATVAGNISLDSTRIESSSGTAVQAAQIQVAGSMSCQGAEGSDTSFSTFGSFKMVGARVEGSINFAGATLTGEYALLADRIRCGAGIRLRENFTATGTVSLQAAEVRGQVDCGAATMNGTPYSLLADGAVVEQDMLLNRGFTARGTVSLAGTQVKGQLSFAKATLDGDGTAGLAARLSGVKAGALLTNWTTAPAGTVDVSGAVVGYFLDFPETWPAAGNLILNDFTYERLSQPDTVKRRLEWLKLNKFGYVPQVYDALAETYRAASNDESARTVLIEKQRARREHPGARNVPARWWSTFLRLSVGYGYAPARIVPWLLATLVMGTVLFAGPANGSMVPTNDAAKAQDLQPFLYTLDLLVPVASIGVSNGWTPTGAAQWLVVAFTLTGWLFGLTLGVALSGALKRD